MRTEIIKPNNPLLKNIIQYFIFFQSDQKVTTAYSTFPNTNLCLAIYKQNKIIIQETGTGKNLSTLEGSSIYKSYVSAFHEANFNVDVNSAIDEVCIIFEPAAVRLFSNVSYDELLKSDEALEMVFSKVPKCFSEKLFEEKANSNRASMLENLILQHLKHDYLSHSTIEILSIINQNSSIKVSELAKMMGMNVSTLYRLFVNQIGQSPKMFLRTVRFRKALDELLVLENRKLTDIAYENAYNDQSHFIRDFREITGAAPGELIKKTSVQQQELVWIYSGI